MRTDLDKICVTADKPIASGLSVLNSTNQGICFVVDEQSKILGTVTDGDCRRALLAGKSLNSSIKEAMHTSFIAVDSSFSTEQIHALMKTNGVKQIPIVDDQRRLIDIVLTRAALSMDQPAHVMILAGGKGTRLRPLTENVPKPMLPVGGRPMLANLIDSLTQHNFCDIFLSISYLGEQIEDYFEDGSKWGCRIKYLREEQELGTAGPLSLMPLEENKPILVVNGDLVTKVNFTALFDYHVKSKSDFTIGTSSYSVEVPFGVLNLGTQGQVQSVSEKPVISFPINAGIYMLNSPVARMVQKGQHLKMTELIESSIAQGLKVGGFAIHERWLDVGLPEQYKTAQGGI